jgi:hypothetical protein
MKKNNKNLLVHEKSFPYKITIVNDNLLYGVSDIDHNVVYLMKSTDGGRTWKFVKDITSFASYPNHSELEKYMYMGGNDYVREKHRRNPKDYIIGYRYYDDGRVLHDYIKQLNDFNPTSILFLNENVGYIGGMVVAEDREKRLYSRIPFLIKTVDGGKTWEYTTKYFPKEVRDNFSYLNYIEYVDERTIKVTTGYSENHYIMLGDVKDDTFRTTWKNPQLK